jgi:hypothetical protein
MITCPNCNGENYAEILWGLCDVDEKLEQAIKKKEITLGGCLVTDHDPQWECNECHSQWGIVDHD